MSKHTQQLVIIFIVGILAGAAITKVGIREDADMLTFDESRSKVLTGDESALIQGEKESIAASQVFPLVGSVPMNTRLDLSVPDQGAGTQVEVTHILVAEPTWVAIYEESNNMPGSILGAKKVLKGDMFTTVPLLRPEGLTAGKVYFAVLLTDNGDGLFDRKTDAPPTPSEKVIMVKFRAL